MAKEVMGAAANIVLLPGKGELLGYVEVVLIVTEPVYRVDAGGQLIKERVTDQFRFHSGATGLRQLAEDFAKFADEAEELARRAGGMGQTSADSGD